VTEKELSDLLQETGIPFAHHHWETPPRPPYGVYLFDSTDNFAADDTVYAVVEKITLELYTVGRGEAEMRKIEAVLERAGIFWDRDTEYIKELRLFQTSYEIEV